MTVQEAPRIIPRDIEPRREKLSDAEVGGFLAAIGNHEGKAKLLASMKPGRGYSLPQLHTLSLAQGKPVWSENTPFDWCLKSMSKIKLVTKEIVDREKGIVGFEITDKGKDLGVALAGHLLLLSEKYPEISLNKLMGATNSSSKKKPLQEGEPEDPENKIRSPLTRYRIFQELLTADLPLKRDDLGRALANDYPDEYYDTHITGTYLFPHLTKLDSFKIISYKTIKSNTPITTYKATDNKPSGEPTALKHNKAFTKTVYDIVMQASKPITSSEVYKILIKQDPERKKLDMQAEMSHISNVLAHLRREGYVTQLGEYRVDKHTVINLNPRQREIIEDFVTIIDKFQNQDAAFLEEGRRLARTIASDPVRSSALLHKAKESSSNVNSIKIEKTNEAILAYLSTHPDSTNNDIFDFLSKTRKTLSRQSVRAYTRKLRNNGKISQTKEGNVLKYSLVEEKSETKGPQETVIFFGSDEGKNERLLKIHRWGR